MACLSFYRSERHTLNSPTPSAMLFIHTLSSMTYMLTLEGMAYWICIPSIGGAAPNVSSKKKLL